MVRNGRSVDAVQHGCPAGAFSTVSRSTCDGVLMVAGRRRSSASLRFNTIRVVLAGVWSITTGHFE